MCQAFPRAAAEPAAPRASSGVRRVHRVVSIVFTLTVVANFAAMAGGGSPSPWITYAPLLPLALLLFTGLYLFVLPYLGRRRESGGHPVRAGAAQAQAEQA